MDNIRANRDGEHFSALKLIIDAPAEDGHQLTDLEIREAAAELLFAGHETVASSLTTMVALLAQNPSVIEKARKLLGEGDLLESDLTSDDESLTLKRIEEVPYISYIIDETLRSQPPVAGAFRQALTTIEYKAGSFCNVN